MSELGRCSTRLPRPNQTSLSLSLSRKKMGRATVSVCLEFGGKGGKVEF